MNKKGFVDGEYNGRLNSDMTTKIKYCRYVFYKPWLFSSFAM